MPLFEAMKNTKYMDMFGAKYEVNQNESLLNNSGSGKPFVLKVILDGHQSVNEKRKSGHFVINLNQAVRLSRSGLGI